MSLLRLTFLSFMLLFASEALLAQLSSVNFHKLRPQDGLHDPVVRCITQDKYGYLWIGTVGALNRYNGRTVQHFTNVPGDTLSPYMGQARCMHTSQNGRLWIGYDHGLIEFDYSTTSFKRIPGFKDVYVTKIISVGDSVLFLQTYSGFMKYNLRNHKVINFTQSEQKGYSLLYKTKVGDMTLASNVLYITSRRGILELDPKTQTLTEKKMAALGDYFPSFIAVDRNKNFWLGFHGDRKLWRIDAAGVEVEKFDHLFSSSSINQFTNVQKLYIGSNDRLWVCTAIDGLIQYDINAHQFRQYIHDERLSTSISSNFVRTVFEDSNGIIWLGGEPHGINYFNPDSTLFETILPFPDRLNENQRAVGRAVTQDKDGNFWMGTAHGVSRYNIKTNVYTYWQNANGQPQQLYSNTVRSIWCDAENNVWIGTSNGVNKFSSSTNRMEFVPQEYLPRSFYNSINEDRSGNVWFCTNDSMSLYYYNIKDKRFGKLSDFPLLAKYEGLSPTSYVMEDSKNRLWISINRHGVVMWDKKNNAIHQYKGGEDPSKNIVGDMVIDIKEDKKGVIWVSSFQGISGIDVENHKFTNFNNKNGLVSNWVGALAVDNKNRLWIGANGGLMLLDEQRKNFTTFSLNDGLPSVGFPEHAGIVLQNGEIVFPTYHGYIKFDPSKYVVKKSKFDFFVNAYVVLDKNHNIIHEADTFPSISLGKNESSFSIEMVALNYTNNSHTWYAYLLDGFDDQWHYTQDPKAVYTNVPGGNYTFRYKATENNAGWDEVKEKQVAIHLDTAFYKTLWFKMALVIVFSSLLWAFYKYRSNKQQQLYDLLSKSQKLEKEKSVVMYDGLKQQLNPHFLFNSLTSLSALIETNQSMASTFLSHMSDMYRYILKNGENETVTLKDELNFVKTYIQLQQTRFGEGLIVAINVPEEMQQFKIAPVTLQNTIENAIKHNIIDIDSPLVIDIYIEEDYLIVKNNLQKKINVETSNKRGLVQFTSFYKYLSDKPVLIEETALNFSIKIPLI